METTNSVANQSCLVRVRISFERGNASLTLEELGVNVPAGLSDFAAQFISGGVFKLCPVEKVNALQSIAVTMRNAPLKYGFRSDEFRGVVVKSANIPACVERLEALRTSAIGIKDSILAAYDIDKVKIESRCETFARIVYATSIGETSVDTLQTWETEGYTNAEIRRIAAEMKTRIPTRAAFAQRFRFDYSITRLSLSQSVVSQEEYETALARIAELEDTPENRAEKQRLEILRTVHEASAESAKRAYEAQVSELISRSVATVRETVLAMSVELSAAVAKEGKITKRHAQKLAAMRDAAKMLAWDGDEFTNWVATQTTSAESAASVEEMSAILATMRANIQSELLAQNEDRAMREETPGDTSELDGLAHLEELRVVRVVGTDDVAEFDTVEQFTEELRVLRD